MSRTQEPPWVARLDRTFAACVAALLVVSALAVPGGPRSPIGVTVALCCIGLQATSLLWIRYRPLWAMAVALAAGIGLEVLSPGAGWLGQVAGPLAYFTWLRPRIAPWLTAVLIAATPVKLIHGGWRDVMLAAAAPLLGWTLGELGRTRGLRRDEFRRRVAAEERARIAREVHDVIAHTVSVIGVQAAAAVDIFDARPDRAREALGAIQTAAATAMAELRTMLHALRPDIAPGETSGTAPQPGLADLEALADSLGETGLRVVLRQEVEPRSLSASVDLSAYRIVQESLTNTLRHSRSIRAEVTVSIVDGVLRVEIRDTGPAKDNGHAGGGHGILGMRERTRLLGGEFDAGPQPDGGFRVRATLPLEARA